MDLNLTQTELASLVIAYIDWPCEKWKKRDSLVNLPNIIISTARIHTRSHIASRQSYKVVTKKAKSERKQEHLSTNNKDINTLQRM